MKVVHVSFHYDESITKEEELLEKHYTVTGWAEALQQNGAEVIVMNRFGRNSSLEQNKVQYHFVHDSLPSTIKGRHLPLQFLKKISRLQCRYHSPA
jgi:hypothetical protein